MTYFTSNKLQELVDYRYLLQNLVVRDLKVRYKNSILGVMWSLLNPLLMMIVFSLVFTFALGDESIRQYPVFFLVGLIPWNFFNNALRSGTMSILTNASLIKKIYFPRELLPFAAVLSQLVNFGFSFIVLILFLYIFGLGLTVHALWVIPLLITQVLFTLGLVLLMGSINVFYRDILMILDLGLLALFFLTPIVYPLDLFLNEQTLMGITFDPARVMRWVNPMASIVDGYRTVLWGTMASSGPSAMFVPYLVRTFVTSLIVFIVGYIVFLRTETWFGEIL
ncbi:MAG: ABC transporter permease [Chloroflexota bacterium]